MVDWGLICACVMHVCVPVCYVMCVPVRCICVYILFDGYICMTACKYSC